MRTTQQPQSRRRQVLGRTLLALGVTCAVLGTLATGALPAARAREQASRAVGVACLTCPHYSYFRQTATAANSAGDYTILDSASTIGQPGAVLLVTELVNGFSSDHNLGVWYDSWIGRWTIFYQDGAAIAAGTHFNVNVVTPGHTGSTAFLQQAATGNIVWDSTVLSNPNSDNQPNAIILVTPVYGATDLYENHPIGVLYTGSHWAIFNEDLAPMAPGELFAVVIWPAATEYERGTGGTGDGYTVTTTASTTSWDTAVLSSSDEVSYYWVTPNWGTAGVLNNHPIGLWFDPPLPTCINPPWCAGTWYVMNKDLASMPVGLTFNVEDVLI